jgi:urease accessory protein
MRELTSFAEPGVVASDRLTLPFELRQKSRLRARLDGGEEVALILPRGRVLRDGDMLVASDGFAVRVCAAPEKVSTATSVASNDPVALARAAYHLGNRHVPVQLGAGFVRYQRDHVLDEMVRGLGLAVTEEDAAFEPEAGAYGEHEYAHGGGHGHSHGHAAPGAARAVLQPRPPHRGYDHGDGNGDES